MPHALAILLWLQVMVAGLIALRVVPFPSSWGVRPPSGSVSVVCIFLSLTSLVAVLLWRQRAEDRSHAELLHLAFHDIETGLPNRAALEQTLTGWLEKGHPCSCICMELYGIDISVQQNHELLQSCVLQLFSSATQNTMLCCLSQDRFALLLFSHYSREELSRFAEQLLNAAVSSHLPESKLASISMSVGIASAPGDANGSTSLLAAAKRAMASARSDDGDQFRFAEDLQSADQARTSLISGKLQRALIGNSLQLVYQPIYSSAGQMVAAEALARWYDVDEGEISPSEFIPIAEATGLIVPLSNWVLRKACLQMAQWRLLGTPIQRIAVNVCVKQVCRKDFIETVQRTLRETGLNGACLELEVTEGALATDVGAVNRNLQALRKTGVRISIDDFGTGYSSLSRVRELNADVLKVDRMFTQAATESEGGAAMLQAIINMAHTMQLSVISEGIETAEQMNLLRRMGCDEMQGFLLSKPKAAEVLTRDLQQAIPASPQTEQPVGMAYQPVAAS